MPSSPGMVLVFPTLTAKGVMLTGTNPTIITVDHDVSPTTTIRVMPTELLIISEGRTFRFRENLPERVFRIYANAPIDLIILSEEEYIKLAQRISYEPLYVKADILNEDVVIKQLTVNDDPYYVVFSNKYPSDAILIFEMRNEWKAFEFKTTQHIITRQLPDYVFSNAVTITGALTMSLAIFMIFYSLKSGKMREVTKNIEDHQ